MEPFNPPISSWIFSFVALALDFGIVPIFLMTTWNQSVSDIFDVKELNYKQAFMLRICIFSFTWIYCNANMSIIKDLKRKHYIEQIISAIEKENAPGWARTNALPVNSRMF
jgi:hypothetical protein